MRVGALHRFAEFGNDVRRRGAIGITHRHVDDVFAAPACGHLELGGNVEDVGRKTINARKTPRIAGLGHVFSFT